MYYCLLGIKKHTFFLHNLMFFCKRDSHQQDFKRKVTFLFYIFSKRKVKSPHYQTLNNDLNFFLTVMPHFKEKLRVWLGSLASTLLKLGHTYLCPRKLLWWARSCSHTETLHALKAAEETWNYLQVVSTNMSHQNKDLREMFNAWVLTMANSIR